MSTKHTPGPWTATPIAQGTADYCIHARGIPWQLAYLSENSQIEWPIEANARLIAAAPDLVAALKQARVDIDTITDAANVNPDFAFEHIDAALAKAGAL